MSKVKKIVVSILMTLVWLVMFAMVIPMKSLRGQVTTVIICLLINTVLGVYYSLIDKRPASIREWFKQ